jgi:hypothetical protein
METHFKKEVQLTELGVFMQKIINAKCDLLIMKSKLIEKEMRGNISKSDFNAAMGVLNGFNDIFEESIKFRAAIDVKDRQMINVFAENKALLDKIKFYEDEE